MRQACIGVLVLFLAATIAAQSTAEQLLSNPYESACGRPLADGKVYDYREGRISSVTNDNVLVFHQKDLNGNPKIETIRVRLAGIVLRSSDVRLNSFLKRTLVSRDVVIAGNKRDAADGEMIGSVWMSSLNDVSQHLLKKNLAVFKEPKYEAVSAFSLCVLKQVGK